MNIVLGTTLRELEEKMKQMNEDERLAPEMDNARIDNEAIGEIEGAVGGIIEDLPDVHNIQVEIHDDNDSDDNVDDSAPLIHQ